MVRLLRNELGTIWFDGIKPKITQEDFKKLQQQAPGTWGRTEKIDEFRMLNTSTLWKYDFSILIQDVLNIKAKKPLTYQFAEGLTVRHLFRVAEILEIEIPEKINGRQLTDLISKKLGTHS